MKLARAKFISDTSAARMRQCAFTITELMVTLSLCVLISAAVAASQLFGARMTELTQTKIHTSDRAVQLMRLLGSDIRNSRKLRIGAGSASSFVPIASNTPQYGNALQVYPTEDTNSFVRYFHRTSDNTLQRMDDDGSLATVAFGVTNTIVFRLEDFAGVVLNDRQRNAVVGLDLGFHRLENPDVPVGPQHYYKSYRFRTRIAQPML
jgi:type II secretory pathway pseudopilin PulG